MSNLSVWLTPIWLIAVGTSIGGLILLVSWAISFVVNRRLANALQRAVRESILLPVTYALIALAALALVAIPVMPVDRLISSLKRLPNVGPIAFEETIPPGTEDFELAVSFRADELQRYEN